MAEFVHGDHLNFTLNNLIRNADEYLFLISPYIKLHSKITDALKSKKNSPNLAITVVFGKSEAYQNNRISGDDLEFLTSFPNIEIRYEKNLHAKYYASEDGALITSLNLYDVSQDNNIEAGVYLETPKTLVGKLTGWAKETDLDVKAFHFFEEVIENSKVLFKRTPLFEEGGFMGLSKNYVESKIETDLLTAFFDKPKAGFAFTGYKSYDKDKGKGKTESPAVPLGYCIRTGKPIPFNKDKPLSAEAYKSWSKYENKDFQENFCHFSGEPSNGLTTYATPILKKNWQKAKEVFKF
ncbi:MAG: hypothetical protein K0S09_2622 [Sphingobacteriaceae bacterium]|jgi:hypothetical protein|nr:hypothetical protein [Sphingobacteriaceae bacterium]